MQPVTKMEPRAKLRIMLPWIAVGVVLAAIITGVVIWKLKPAKSQQIIRFHNDLPEGQQFGDLGFQALAVSPDGTGKAEKLASLPGCGLFPWSWSRDGKTMLRAADPFIGTWKVNAAKSKLEGLGLKSGVTYCEIMSNGIKSGFEGVNIEGKTFRSEWSGKYDGKDPRFSVPEA
jgi:hypothetical protein